MIPMAGKPHFSVMALAAALMWTATGGTAGPPTQVTVEAAVAALIEEADAAIAARTPPAEPPDYADRCDCRVGDRSALAEALVHRVHTDPFIDAYVRWQMTSFDVSLPDLDDAAFARFMDRAPALLDNPWADEAFIARLEAVDATVTLSESDLAALRSRLDELHAREALARAFNRPAEGFHDWVEEQLGRSGPRRLQWLLVRCAAIIEAGWSTRAIKTRMTRTFTEAAGDTSLTARDRAMLADHISRLAGLERRFVRAVNIRANRTIKASYSTARASEADVEKWIERLNGPRPDLPSPR